MSRRIDGPEQRFDGIAVAAIEPAFYDRFYKDLNLGPNDAVTLLHADGTLMARTPERFDLIGRKLLGLQLFQRQLAARPQGTYVAASDSFDSQDRIVSYRRIPVLPLIIAVSLSKTGVLANWYRTAWAAALGATLLLAPDRHRRISRGAAEPRSPSGPPTGSPPTQNWRH